MENSYGRRGGNGRRFNNEYGHSGSRGRGRGGNRRNYGDRNYTGSYDDPSHVDRRTRDRSAGHWDRDRERLARDSSNDGSGEREGNRGFRRGGRGRPPGLRGKEIGLYYAGLSKKKSKMEESQSRASIEIDSHRERHLTNLLANIRAADSVQPQPSRSYRDAFDDEEDDESTFKMGSDTEAYGAVPREQPRQTEVPTSWEDFDEDSTPQPAARSTGSAATAGASNDAGESSACNFYIDRKGAKSNFDDNSDDDSDNEDISKDDRLMYDKVGDEEMGEPEDQDMDDTEVDAWTPKVSEMFQMQTESDFVIEFKSHRAANRRSNDRLQDINRMDQSLTRNETLDTQLKEELDYRTANSKQYIKMVEFRKKLPSYQMRAEVLKVINENQVTVISGETGCGKTTQVSQFILDDYIAKGNGSLCHIVCTQPRRISAISVAERVADERAERCGENGSVGFQIRLEKKMPRKQGSILYCTTGIMLQWLASDPGLSQVSHIILDEIHERDLQSDFLMIVLKDVIRHRRDLKLVLMSATLNAHMFSEYFGGSPMLNIPGFTYPVTEFLLEDIIEMTRYKHNVPLEDMPRKRMPRGVRHGPKKHEYFAEQENFEVFLRNLPDKYSRRTKDVLSHMDMDNIDVDLIVNLVGHIVRTKDDGAILIFLPGWEQISKVNRALEESGFGHAGTMRIIPLHSMMPTVNQREVFNRPPPGIRKVVIATNIAETSITIDDVVYVIDCGKIKMKNFDPEHNISTLAPEWVALANAKQRRGRAGRVAPGECYHLYTSYHQTTFAAYQLPEILRTRLEELCLQIKLLKLGRVAPFVQKAMQPPSMEALEISVQMLKDLNALDDNEDLTPLGYHLAKMPVDPQTGKMLLFAAMFSCLDPVLTVAASLSFKDAFYIPLGKEKIADQRRRELSENTCSDHLMLSMAYNGWERAESRGTAGQYCYHNFMAQSTLRMLSNMRRQFSTLLHKMKFLDSDNPKAAAANRHSSNRKLVKAVITAGLYPNVARVKKAKRGHRETKLVTKTENSVCIHPKSVNSQLEEFQSQWLIYHLKMKTMRINLYDCTVISPYPLLFFGGKIDYRRVEESNCLVVDDWIIFKASQGVAHLVKELRVELDKLLQEKITNPGVTDWNPKAKEGALMRAILDLITTADH